MSNKRTWAFRSLSILVVLSILVTGFVGVSGYNDVKQFRNTLHSDLSESERNVEALKRDLKVALRVSDIPVISQALNLLDLNFASIQNEIFVGLEIAPILFRNGRTSKYLIAFQNSAEARGTGGILGAFAVVEFKNGQFRVVKTGSNQPLYGISLAKVPIKVPNEFLKLYGHNPAIIQNSNLSPHFPYGAEIWLELWKKEFGEQLDGVIAIDPIALSYVLKSTRPIKLTTGEVITSENVVSETLQKAYKRYENDNNARKQYLVDLLNAASRQITSGQYSKIEMARAIKRGIVENRILMYSRDDLVQSKLSTVRIGGYMSTKPNNEFRVVIQNIDAGKLDYYLKKEATVESKSCGNPHQTQVRVKVTNTLKSGDGLPAYVLTRADKGKPLNAVPGQHRFKVFVYGPVGSTLISVNRENKSGGLGGAATERGRPIYVADVDLKPGESENLLANFSGGVGKITFIDQPLVIPTKLTIKGGC